MPSALGMPVRQFPRRSVSQWLSTCAIPKTDNRSVAVIGDGALTGGMAFEGLNNAGHQHFPFIVVLNDNEMSIAPNVGAISKYLDRVRTDRRYNRAKDDIQAVLERDAAR